MRRHLAFFSLLVALALALPTVAGAARPPKPGEPTSVTAAATPSTLVFGRTTVISGQLKGGGVAGQTIQLQQNPYPFAAYKDVAKTTTDANGFYRFSVVPALNTRYRVIAETRPRHTSPEVFVYVRPDVYFKLSDYTPRRGQLVRFAGTVSPAHDGQFVHIQRRTSTGSYVTVVRTRLVPTTALPDGRTRSGYSYRLRINRSGTYRVLFPRHADHATGISRRLTAVVH